MTAEGARHGGIVARAARTVARDGTSWMLLTQAAIVAVAVVAAAAWIWLEPIPQMEEVPRPRRISVGLLRLAWMAALVAAWSIVSGIQRCTALRLAASGGIQSAISGLRTRHVVTLLIVVAGLDVAVLIADVVAMGLLGIGRAAGYAAALHIGVWILLRAFVGTSFAEVAIAGFSPWRAILRSIRALRRHRLHSIATRIPAAIPAITIAMFSATHVELYAGIVVVFVSRLFVSFDAAVDHAWFERLSGAADGPETGLAER